MPGMHMAAAMGESLFLKKASIKIEKEKLRERIYPVFDVNFHDGLYLYVVTGDTGTSTVTFR